MASDTFCLVFFQLLGQSQEAMGAYVEIINRNLADESSLAVTVNNLIAVKGPKEVSDSLRKLDRIKEKDMPHFRLARILDMKLSSKQKEAIYANRVLLLLHANKMDQVVYSYLAFFSLCSTHLYITYLNQNDKVSFPRFSGLLMSFVHCLKFTGSRTCCCASRPVS